MLDPTLDVRDLPTGVAFIPGPIELLGRRPELDDEVAGQVLRFGFPALFAAKAATAQLSSLPMMIRASEPPMK